jgi:alpha-tubulin suppressor-like RCC1 family protein
MQPTTASYQTIAGGFAHSCFISSTGRFYIWGDNKNGQLACESTQACIEEPTLVKLAFKGAKYLAKSVCCGDRFTLIIAQSTKNMLALD